MWHKRDITKFFINWKALSSRIYERASIRVYGSKSAQKSYKKGPVSAMAVNRPGWCPWWVRGKPLPEKATENCATRVTFPIRASDSCRKLLTAEVWTIRACTAVLESCTVSFNGRDRPTDQRLVYGKSTRMLGSFLPFSFPEKWKEQLFIIYNLCWVSILHAVLNWTLRVELFILSTLSSCVL